MIKKFKVTIPELSGNVRRRAYVYIPNEAKRNPDKRYPVLYMFDGHNVFFDSDATYGKSWGMKTYMDYTKTPLIIAAVECNHQGNRRLCEYSPFSFSDKKMGDIEGCGKQTMEWIINCFKPYIDENYPTLTGRENTFIAGSSMGGLMSLYAVSRYNSVFSKAACLSPSIWFEGKSLDNLLLSSDIAEDTVVYMDYGENEMNYRRNMKSRFKRITNILIDKKVKLTARIVPDGYHCEASWEKQIPFFMNTLLYRSQDGN